VGLDLLLLLLYLEVLWPLVYLADLDLQLPPLSLEFPESLGFLVHQLLLSDLEYLEYLADLLDPLVQLALEPLVFLAGPVLLFLLYFHSDLYFQSLPHFQLLQYFQSLPSHLYFHSVHLLALSHQLLQSDLEVLQMGQLSLLDLLFQSDH
jgi:hypothetical protein